ncbi:MAG: alginate export family protein [Planctomycetota bacterium]|nr:alginate export family protein [Planctomycetota bacterium]MDE1888666.1 alginate export family protein [Planctomycetota bacterium]MDE2215789.1 alginate export family protein [Planctomycetota bacterium]
MKNSLWKTCIGGLATAVFCVVACSASFGANGKSIEEMEKDLNALRASVSSLTEQIESVKQEKTVAAASDTRQDVEALRSEVSTLKEEMKTAAQAEQTLKASDIDGNVYSEFAKKVKLGGQIRTRAEYASGLYQTPSNSASSTIVPGATTGGTTSNTLSSTVRNSANDTSYVLNQTRLWADADVNEHLRVFIQLQDARAFGSENGTIGFASSSVGNVLDLHQGYFDLKKLFDLPLTVRVGRQEIIWGDHRVIGNFVWSNIGRVFDGGRFMWDTDAIHAEAFAAQVKESGWVNAVGSASQDENVYAGQLAFKKLVPSALLELMYIQKNDQNGTAQLNNTGFSPTSTPAVPASAAPGGNHIVIHDFGVRIDGKVPNLDAVDYTVESHGQFGHYGSLVHRAFAGAAKSGYTFKEMTWKPRLGVEYDYASGDKNLNDGVHGTFDNLYPTNHMNGIYGFADMVSWQNMHDIRGQIKVQPTNKLTAQADYHYFWLASARDGWYLANGSLAGSSSNTGSNSLASEIDLTLSYALYKNVSILAGYSFFNPSAWITRNNGGIGDDTHWSYLQTTVTF